MSRCITLDSAPMASPAFKAWVGRNGLQWCTHLRATDDTLTAWVADFRPDFHTRYQRSITTTPADPAQEVAA